MIYIFAWLACSAVATALLVWDWRRRYDLTAGDFSLFVILGLAGPAAFFAAVVMVVFDFIVRHVDSKRVLLPRRNR